MAISRRVNFVSEVPFQGIDILSDDEIKRMINDQRNHVLQHRGKCSDNILIVTEKSYGVGHFIVVKGIDELMENIEALKHDNITSISISVCDFRKPSDKCIMVWQRTDNTYLP